MTKPSQCFDQSTKRETTRPSNNGLLDAESWHAIVEDDYRKVIHAINWQEVFPKGVMPYQLLDIGCGMGTFPHLLRPHLPTEGTVFYDYLDTAHYCLSMCQQVLHPPYYPRRAYHTTIEEAAFDAATTVYHVVWALQSLYTLTPKTLGRALKNVNQVLCPTGGTILLLMNKHDAFIPQMYERYTRLFSKRNTTSYLTAEPVLSTLSSLGMPAVVRELDCTHTISIRDDYRLEQYLQQCVMDSQPPTSWRHHPQMRDFLDSFRHVDTYRFPNPVWLILCAPAHSGSAGRQRILQYLEPVSESLVA